MKLWIMNAEFLSPDRVIVKWSHGAAVDLVYSTSRRYTLVQ